jgi:hypothetical protein
VEITPEQEQREIHATIGAVVRAVVADLFNPRTLAKARRVISTSAYAKRMTLARIVPHEDGSNSAWFYFTLDGKPSKAVVLGAHYPRTDFSPQSCGTTAGIASKKESHTMAVASKKPIAKKTIKAVKAKVVAKKTVTAKAKTVSRKAVK